MTTHILAASPERAEPIAPVRAPISPITGLYRGARVDPLHFFVKMAEKHDLVEFPNPAGRFFLVNNSEYIERILQGNYRNYPKSSYYRRVRPIFGDGLFELEGEEWRHKRQTVQPAFHKDRIEALSSLMTSEIGALLDSWQGFADTGKPVNIVPPLMQMAFQVITKAISNEKIPGDLNQLTESLTVIMREGERILWSLLPFLHSLPSPRKAKLGRAIDTFDRMMYEIIARRRDDPGHRGDMLDMLFSATNYETGEPLSLIELRDDLMTMLIAGHETTAVAIGWICYHLSKSPDIARRLKAEVDQVLGGRTPTVADLKNMPYSLMVAEETLRLYPPFWTVSRQAAEDDQLGKYHIPAGATLMLCPYVTHRNPKYWDNPEGFDPERFAPGKDVNRPQYAYFPFGGGPRVCIGKNMALMEAQLYLAMLMQRYSLHLVPGHRVEPEAMISLRPKDGIMMTVTSAR